MDWPAFWAATPTHGRADIFYRNYSAMQFLGIDIGTSSTKGVVVDESGRILSRSAVAHCVQSAKAGRVEQDAEKSWWGDSVQVIRSLLTHSAVDREAIAGIGVSGLFPALLLADRVGAPLRPAILYSDNRAFRELVAFNEHFGLNVTNDAVPPKLAWLRTHEPDNFSRAQRFFSSHNYVVYRLTGSYCLDYKVADAMGGLLDRHRLVWGDAVANWAGIRGEDLPALDSEVKIVGSVTEAASEETGLRPGTPVIAGSGDSLLILVSAGAIEQGDVLVSFGSTGWITSVIHSLSIREVPIPLSVTWWLWGLRYSGMWMNLDSEK